MSQKYKSGYIVNNRYELISYIGSGTYGEVWKCKDKILDIVVAIKFYVSLDEKGRKEFIGEYKTAYGLHHPNLLTATYYDVWDDRPYLVMEYCENGASDKLVGNTDEQTIWRFIRDVAQGLSYLHNLSPNPIIHQDIKPENVLINSKNDFVISDFGISMNVRSTMRKQSGRSNETGGAIAYMGPERFSANPMPIKASDVWSLGASIYEMATGELPFCGMGGGMLKNGAEIPVLPQNWSPQLNNIVRACMAKEPWDRPLAHEIVELASSVLEGAIDRPSPIMVTTNDTSESTDSESTDSESTATPPHLPIIYVILGVVVIGLSLFFILRSGNSLEKEAVKNYPNYQALVEKCEKLTDIGDSSKYQSLIEAKKAYDSIISMENRYSGVNGDYCISSEFGTKLNDKLKKASRSWTETAYSQLYELEDEEGAIGFYKIALSLYDDPNNHIVELDEKIGDDI